MKLTYLTFLAALALTFTSCKKETNAPHAPTGTADLKVKIGLVNGHSHVDMDHTFTDGAGNAIKFTELKFFVGHMHLEGHHGDEIAAFHDYHLFDGSAHHNTYNLGQIPADRIHYLNFKIGLDEHACAHDPHHAPAPFNTPGMHCHDVGYRFLSMAGRVDADGDGDFDGPADIDFNLHCGAPDMLRHKQLNVHQDIAAGSTVTLQLEMNVAQLLSGLDLRNNPMHMGGGELGAQAMDNLTNAIGVHHH
jgi:hypothetical protein